MKIKFIIIIILFGIIESNAQDIQLNISAGYAIPSFKQTVEGYNDIAVSENQTYGTEASKAFSLGGGYYLNGALQYGFNENIAIGLDLSYLIGQKVEFTQEGALANVIKTTEQELYGNSIRLIPCIILRAEENILRPYFKLGFIMSKTTVELHEKTTIQSEVTLMDWEYKSDGNYGISFAGGLSYKVMDNTAIFMEINYQSIRYKPTKSSMVKATKNGNNILDKFPVRDKEISYSSKIDLEYNEHPDINQPQLLHEIYFPFSSLILQFGVNIKLL